MRFLAIATFDNQDGRFGIYTIEAKSQNAAMKMLILEHGTPIDVEFFSIDELRSLADRCEREAAEISRESFIGSDCIMEHYVREMVEFSTGREVTS